MPYVARNLAGFPGAGDEEMSPRGRMGVGRERESGQFGGAEERGRLQREAPLHGVEEEQLGPSLLEQYDLIAER